jgi:microcystin-dependent protein
MSTPFLGQIEIFAFNFAPQGWAQCNGQFLPISQNQALFSLLGTTFGGNGQTTFQLPDLRSRVPVCMNGKYKLGESGGEEAHTVTVAEMPAHTHSLVANTAMGTTNTPAGNTSLATGNGSANPGGAFKVAIYSDQAPNGAQYAGTITNSGGSQPHPNLMPYLTVNMCIALQGLFPSHG